MFNLRTIRTVELLGVALILVAVMVTAVYLAKVPAPQPPFPAANPVPAAIVAAAPVSVSPAASNSVYMSTQTIRHILDQAYEQHRWGSREQALLRILNGRYERRSGLPW